MPYLLAALAIGLAFAALSPRVRVESISDVMKRVFVGERSYVVTRLGGGAYNVTNPATLAHVTFNQQGPIEQIGDVRVLTQDMKRFPDSLFKDV